ncbi:MAG: chromosome segregation protein SMC [Coriobacteriia bacterium]|nr:chromosome segregation protein SMC [Coriobacteriia bacterium]
MYLKSLTLKGFKSFADRSRLALEPGVTVVVGPNGSGKSNISDAVLWVLGEQSAKTLRGNSMEDVVFAGSSARQPVGVAEVDLVLDNRNGTLPLEFAEVTITRRMFRNGESEYLINQSPCRLLDVQELLHDTGLGRDTHSIISQGRLDEILSSKPEDRRALIEEAAGVLKHKKRKDRAVRKLAAMDVHVDRIRDVLIEIDRQLRPLQKQADKAHEYRGIQEELRDLEVSLAVGDLRVLQQSWEGVEKREREHDAEIELARYRLGESERELATFQSLLEEKGLFVGDLSEQRRRLQSVLERTNSGLLLLEEKGKNLVERLSEIRQKIHQSGSRLEGHSQEIEQIAEERATTEARLQALYAQLSELRRESETVKKERLAADGALSALMTEARRARKDVDDARTDLAEIDQALSGFTLESDMLAERSQAVRDQKTTLMQTLSARRNRLEHLAGRIEHTRKEVGLAASDVDKRVRLLEGRRVSLDKVRLELADVRAEIRAIDEVDRAFESASPALAAILAREHDLPDVIGPITDHIKVPEEYEQVVERVMGAEMFCVLIKDASALGRTVAVLEEHGASDFSLVPVDTAVAPDVPASGPGVRLLDVIKCPKDIKRALAALIGDVRIVDSLDEAITADPSPWRLATCQGHTVWPSRRVRVGPNLDEDAGVLARKRALVDLRDRQESLDSAVGDAESQVVEASEALAVAQQDALELGQTLAAMTAEEASVREDVGRIEQAITATDAEISSIELRLRQIEEKTDRDRPHQRQLTERIDQGLARIEELEDATVAARELRDTRFREESEVTNRLGTCQVEIAAVSEREVHLKRRFASLTSEASDLEKAVTQSANTVEALEMLRERIQPLHDLYAELLERAEHWADKLRDRARFEQADSESLRQTIHDGQDGVRVAQSALDAVNEAMGEIRVEKAALEVQVTAAVKRIVDELGVPIERALDIPAVEDRSAAADQAHKLRKRIANLGPVNPIALEEFQGLKDRRDFMQGQLDDLLSSRKSLQKVISAIDRKVRDRFLETFELVNNHFQDIFAVLFPGGHASLSLTEPDDPESTGVEVVAQPRGKRLQKMTLLSGGEKSLTALALLFAVYRTRPCPFYILDEVEAALDDTNLRRFIAFVDSLRNHTQFVIVTHQRRTMEMADVLYGVSMQADGVSKVVSQKLERAVAEAATK